MTAAVTVSIVSHRQSALVNALLDDLERLASPHVGAIVVTRNVEEPAPSVPRSLASRTTLVDNRTAKGFGANHNAAFSHCKTPLFAVLNPDLRLTEDPFRTLVATLDHDAARLPPSLAMVAPLIVGVDGTPEDAARELITPPRLLKRRLGRRSHAPVENPDWLAGMFLLVRSEVFAELAGFDSRYFMYCEDFDLCARVRLSGRRFEVVRSVRVIHDARRESHRSPTHLAWHCASLARMWASSAFWRYRRLLERRGT